jgi:hypothetical protein
MLAAYKFILNQQKTWARQRGIKFDDDGYTLSLNSNLFSPILPETKKEFQSGRGGEFGEGGSRGKMQALHSSSAIVVNIFDYWRNRNIETIAQCCGMPLGMTQMQFEKTYPTPLGGIPPHLDIEFRGGIGIKPVAVESKFTELYHRKTKRKIKDKYLNYRDLWAQLPRCKSLIRRIREEEKGKTSFTHLDIPQLLKHILGLTTKFGRKGFELLYLWYDFPCLEADKHRQEIREFKEQIGDDADFRDMTYQELFNMIKISVEDNKDYISYLGDRYFSPTLL